MWWIFALLSALAQVLRNAVMKDLGHKLNEYVNVLGRFLFILPFALVLVIYKGIPAVPPIYWFYSFLSGVFVTIGTLYFSKAFKYSQISLSITLWRLSLVLVLIEEIVFMKAQIAPLGILGIIVTVCGMYLLNIKERHVSLWKPFTMLFEDKGMRYALLSAVFIAQSILLFKITADLSDPYFPALTNYFFASLCTLPVVFKMKAYDYKNLRNHIGKFILMGFFAFLTTIFATVAYRASLATYVEAVKQSEMIFGLAVGMLFFKEQAKIKEIWVSCFVILIGILLIIFNS